MTLMTEEALNKMVRRDGKVGSKYEKHRGLLPFGNHSLFGDFPPDYVPHNLSAKIKMAKSMSTGSLPKIGSASSSDGFQSKAGSRKGLNASMGMKKTFGSSGFSSNPNLPPDSPPRAGSTFRRPVSHTQFRTFYDRGDLPISVMQGSGSGKIVWKVDLDKLDFHHYLPIFFDGLREKEDPYRFLAVTATYDMLHSGGSKILPVVPQLIIPVKTALNTRDEEIMCTMLKVLQKLVLSGDMIGEALVPYYRQILPIFNLFKNKNLNIGHDIDYSQRKRLNLGELIDETLEIFELNGGEDGFINIKYMIPVYESCLKN
jgi:hypothetical protein